MKNYRIDRFLIVVLLLLAVWVTGCKEKTTSSSTTETIEKNDLLFSEESPEKTNNPESFTFNDTHGNTYTLFIKDKEIRFESMKRPLVMIHLFDTNSQESLAQIPYLIQLQEKYEGNLLILAVVMNDSLEKTQPVNAFIKHYGINYVVTAKSEQLLGQTLLETVHVSGSKTQALPVTMLYKDGSLYNFYEGAVPMEMLEYDIDESAKN